MRQTLKTSSHWSGDDGQCMNPGCAVDTCDDQELPDFLRGKTSTFVLQSTTGGFSVEDLEREQQREQHQDQNVYLVSQKMCQQRNCLNKMVLSKASLFLFVEYICEILIVHPSFRVVGDFQAENLLFKNTQLRLGHERVKWVRGRGDCQC